MDDASPKVSVIIPTYNRADILPQAIDSVLEQTFTDFELFVVDDGSPDDTESVVKSYDDDRIRYIKHEKNTGHGGVARNTALERVEGKYVAFLDDDDVWHPTKLEKQVQVLDEADESVVLVYCWMDYYDGDTLVNQRYPTLSGDIFREMLDQNAISAASTLLVRTSVFEDVGMFDADLPRGVDSDFIRRTAKHYEVEYVPEVLVTYHVGHDYERDSDWDESGLRDAIVSTKQKFEKFPEAFEQYPEMRASNLAYIGSQYFLLGSYRKSTAYFVRALRTQPLSWRVYFQMARVGKFYIDRYIPQLGRLIDRYRNWE